MDFIWFIDEKIVTVDSPSNTQNDRLCVAHPVRMKNISARRLLRTRVKFSQSLMVSETVAVSKLGCTELIFVEPAAKINGEYYRDVLMQKLLPAIRRVSGDIFVFQQGSDAAHRARDTIELLGRSKPDFIAPDMWPPTSRTSTRLTMPSGQSCSNMCIRLEIRR